MKHNTEHKVAEWRGYTLEELSHRRAINAVKQEMTIEQISQIYAGLISSGGVTESSNSAETPGVLSKLESGLNQFMTYASYGAKALNIARSIMGIARQFRN